MEASDYLRFALALAFVLALMGIFAQIAKRAGWNKMGMLNTAGKRLSVLEMRPLDPRHKLVLVKCDNREHLLLLGPEGQTVVDSNISQKDAA